MSLSSTWKALGCILATVTVATTGSAADDGFIDAEATDVLQKMCDQLSTASSLSCVMNAMVGVPTESGGLYLSHERTRLAIRRPDRFVADIRTDDGQRRAYYDGKTFTLFHIDELLYASTEAMATVDETLDLLSYDYDVNFALADLFSADSYARLMDGVRFGTYVGLHTANGALCHHLMFEQEDLDWQIWIEDSVDLLPRKFVVIYKDEEGLPQYVADLTDWETGAHFSDAIFTFKAPKGARQIDLTEVDPVGARGVGR